MATNRVKLEDVLNEARTALEAGEADRSVLICRHIFNYFPRCIEASRVLGEAYTEQRLLDEADKLFVFVLSADPQDVLGYVDRGFITFERGNIESAIMYYERALELDPGIEQLREELLRLYNARSGSGPSARLRTSRAGLANTRLRDGFYSQAIEEYQAVLGDTPDRLDAQTGLMEAYWRNSDFDQAEKLAAELVGKQPNLIKANLIMWHLLGVRRQQASAAPYLELAHVLDPLNVVAERLFDDSSVAGEALRYIAMLGGAAVPPLTDDPPGRIAPVLVPEWANTPGDDLDLGLRPASNSPRTISAPDTGFDVFALLADTERQLLQDGKGSETSTVFQLYNEVQTAAPPPPAAEGQPGPSTTGAKFNQSALNDEREAADFSLFEEVTPGLPAWLTDLDAEAEATVEVFEAEVNGPLPFGASPLVYDNPTPPDRQSSPSGEADLPPWMLQRQGSGVPMEPGPEPWPVMPLPPIETPDPDSAGQAPPADEPDYPAPEPPGLPETEPGADPGTPLPMFQGQSQRPELDSAFLKSLLADEEPLIPSGPYETAPVEAANSASWQVDRTPHAFHRRNEQGPLPEFVRQAELALAEPAQVATEPVELPPLLLPDFDFDTPFAVPFKAPPPIPAEASAEPDQENAAMPIKRGPQDDIDVYDWEREDLPDYLQPFVMDENRAVPSGLTDSNQVLMDIDTSPARITPRDQTGGQPDGLPEWYSLSRSSEASVSSNLKPSDLPVPPSPMDFIHPPAPPQPNLPVTGTLPAWVNDAELEPPINYFPDDVDGLNSNNIASYNLAQTPGFPEPLPPLPLELMPSQADYAAMAASEPEDFGDLKLFSLQDDFSFEPPAQSESLPGFLKEPFDGYDGRSSPNNYLNEAFNAEPFPLYSGDLPDLFSVTADEAGMFEPSDRALHLDNLLPEFSMPGEEQAPPPEQPSLPESESLLQRSDSGLVTQPLHTPERTSQPGTQTFDSATLARDASLHPSGRGEVDTPVSIKSAERSEILGDNPTVPLFDNEANSASEGFLNEPVVVAASSLFKDEPTLETGPLNPLPVALTASEANPPQPQRQLTSVSEVEESEASTPAGASSSSQSEVSIQLHPSSPVAESVRQARFWFDQDDINQAISHYKAAIKQADVAGLEPIANSLKELIAAPGSSPRLHRVLGDVYNKQGQFQAALAEYSQALGSISPKK